MTKGGQSCLLVGEGALLWGGRYDMGFEGLRSFRSRHDLGGGGTHDYEGRQA